jgi:hypothetical protein
VATFGLLMLAILLPTAAGYSVVAARRITRWRAETRPPLPGHSLARLSADLHRLHTQLDEAELAPAIPAKRIRRDAVRAAYLDVLGDAATQVHVMPPRRVAGKVSQAEIYRVESDLRAHGIDVRTGALGSS